MAHVSHRLRKRIRGSARRRRRPGQLPLYVFGPFLHLVVAGGVGAVAFGTPIWMVVATVAVVSAMYRHVMQWIPDGSGGSGLCEEEFGGWAVKVNASITAIEYTLHLPGQPRRRWSRSSPTAPVGSAAGTEPVWRSASPSCVGLVVNRGPRLAARVFGPATAAVLALLWVLVLATVLQRGLHLPCVWAGGVLLGRFADHARWLRAAPGPDDRHRGIRESGRGL